MKASESLSVDQLFLRSYKQSIEFGHVIVEFLIAKAVNRNIWAYLLFINTHTKNDNLKPRLPNSLVGPTYQHTASAQQISDPLHFFSTNCIKTLKLRLFCCPFKIGCKKRRRLKFRLNYRRTLALRCYYMEETQTVSAVVL